MRARAWAGVLASMATLVACGGGGDSYGSGPNDNPGVGSSTSVAVRNNIFDPATTTVAVGSTVSWSWAAGSVDHNVTFDDGPKSANQSSGGYSRTFGAKGTYPYRCTNHPAMTGTVKVE